MPRAYQEQYDDVNALSSEQLGSIVNKLLDECGVININTASDSDVNIGNGSGAVTVNSELVVKSNFTAIDANIGGTHSSAIICGTSTTQGFLPPRMTATQKAAITTPATGLMIYQTDASAGVYVYNGSVWAMLAWA